MLFYLLVLISVFIVLLVDLIRHSFDSGLLDASDFFSGSMAIIGTVNLFFLLALISMYLHEKKGWFVFKSHGFRCASCGRRVMMQKPEDGICVSCKHCDLTIHDCHGRGPYAADGANRMCGVRDHLDRIDAPSQDGMQPR